MNTVFVSNSPEETEAFAAKLAESLTDNSVIAYIGGLGLGKTCFTRGLAKGLGFEGEVNSPTFAIVNEYRGGRLDLFHFDMYRIENWEDLYSSGYFDYKDEGGVIAVEWSENITSALEDDTIFVTISMGDRENNRIITVKRGSKA